MPGFSLSGLRDYCLMLASSNLEPLEDFQGNFLYYSIHPGCSYIRGIFVLRLGLGLGTLGKR